MLELINITKRFQSQSVETTALNNLSLTVDAGEFVVVIGSSGCGKSTLLSVAGLLDIPDEGQIRYFSERIESLSKREVFEFRRRKISFIFQDLNLIDELKIWENVALPLMYLSIKPATAKEMAFNALENVGLVFRAEHYPCQLSGGQCQRTAVARALVIKPHLILADEPTGNLDKENSMAVLNTLKEFNNDGASVIMVTHDTAYTSIGNRCVVLHNGQIVSDTNKTIS